MAKHTRQKAAAKNGKLEPRLQPHQPPIQCPECTSQRVWRDGLRRTGHGDVQRYICRSCGFRFSESTAQPNIKVHITTKPAELFNPGADLTEKMVGDREVPLKERLNSRLLLRGKDVRPHGSKPHITSLGKGLNNFLSYNSDCRVCVTETKGAKNLAKVETRQKRAAGATENTKSLLFNFAWQLKKDGFKEKTIEVYVYWLRTLIKHGANPLQPETVKEVLANGKAWDDSSKALATAAYTTFLKIRDLTWRKPKYVQRSKLPFIPTEQEINDLIAHSGRRTSAALRIAKETGARIGEIVKLKWIDLDKEKKTLRINDPEKGSRPRILPVSNDLINALERLPKKSQWIFPSSDPEHPSTGNHFIRLLYGIRKTAVRKLGNPRLEEITFCTLRHWKGTIEYHKTKDILHVMQVLGHKNVKNTMAYINLERAIFKENNDEFSVRAVSDLDEACKLLEVGFEYVCDMDGKKLFRKRK